jgi:hypothetical protein
MNKYEKELESLILCGRHSEGDFIPIKFDYKLSENFIIKYFDYLREYDIVNYQHLSEEFIEKYSCELGWELISTYQNLSEEFIEKYSDKVDWVFISYYQDLSEEFLIEFKNKIYWQQILFNRKLKYKKYSLTFAKTINYQAFYNIIPLCFYPTFENKSSWKTFL